ncbi:MAG: carbohydrate binding domain-containing protein [Polyangiaceae bacterium]
MRSPSLRLLSPAFAALALAACGPAATEGNGPVSPAKGAPTGGRLSSDAVPGGGNNLLRNSTFDDGTSLPWTTSWTAPAEGKAAIKREAFCLSIKNRGQNPWDAQIRHREMVIRKGHTYTVKFRAWASRPTRVRPKVGMSGPPYGEYWASTIDLKSQPQTFAGAFVMNGNNDPTAELAFHMGGNLASEGDGLEVCFDDIHLDDPDFTPPPKPPAIKHPSVRVNQVGYFPSLFKKAIVKNVATSPLPWELVGEGGGTVASGNTAVFGDEPLAGEHVHTVDFSSFNKPGERYILKVAGEGSYPFDIGKTLYSRLKYDALAYFYHNRSGIEIAMPHAGREDLARPAGHTGDKSVPCMPGSGCS